MGRCGWFRSVALRSSMYALIGIEGPGVYALCLHERRFPGKVIGLYGAIR